MTHQELKTWAAELTDEQIGAALNEMRDRGAAVAYYDTKNILELFNDLDETDVMIWMEENYAFVEEQMCEAAREIFKRELVDGLSD